MRVPPSKTVAVDFDGTLVKDKWPNIGAENPYAVQSITLFRQLGYKIILLTCREGEKMTKAVNWMDEHSISPDYTNCNPEAESYWGECRKVYADLYIDDHSILIPKHPDGSVNWLPIYRMLKRLQASDSDVVNKPSHYQTPSGLQPIDVIESFSLNFHLGNAVKYILRAGKKNGNSKEQDLNKALFYLTRELENHQNE